MKISASFSEEDKVLVASCLAIIVCCWAAVAFSDYQKHKAEAAKNRQAIEAQLKDMGYEVD